MIGFIRRKLPKTIFRLTSRKVLGAITHVETKDNVAALTFDDGPDPKSTPNLLEILKKHGAKATFFMIGKNAERYPHIVRQVAQAHHAIGNHSWDHPSFPLISGRKRRAEIRACAKAISPYGQRLFRPTFGQQTLASSFDALFLSYKVITWNIEVEDWLDHDANWITAKLMNGIKPGSVVLLHDSLYHTYEDRYADRKPVLDAVDTLLEQLSGHFRFVTIPELLKHGRPKRQYWYRGSNLDWMNSLNRMEK